MWLFSSQGLYPEIEIWLFKRCFVTFLLLIFCYCFYSFLNAAIMMVSFDLSSGVSSSELKNAAIQ